jgi:hypothetical protein
MMENGDKASNYFAPEEEKIEHCLEGSRREKGKCFLMRGTG